MALPSSGQISVSDILAEGGQSSPFSNISFENLEGGLIFQINSNSPSVPTAGAPHALSEWYDYDHSAVGFYYWDLSNDLKWDNATDKPLDSTSEDFSISLWIRPQWAATDLNLIIFDLTPSGTSLTANRFFLQYDYGGNFFNANYRSNSVNFLKQWRLHENNSVTGTGTSSTDYWTSSNRGNTNSDGFVHLLLNYDASQASAGNAFSLYWNGSALTNSFTNSSGTRSSMTLHEITFCGNDHNTGGSRIADYMYMHMWDQLTLNPNLSNMYNSGTPISAADASYTTNLIFGDTSTSLPSVNDPDDSNNYDFAAANGQLLVEL